MGLSRGASLGLSSSGYIDANHGLHRVSLQTGKMPQADRARCIAILNEITEALLPGGQLLRGRLLLHRVPEAPPPPLLYRIIVTNIFNC